MARWSVLVPVLLGVIVLALLFGGWAFFRHPLAVNAARERLTLRLSGFSLEKVPTSAGSLRAWVKGEGPCLVFLHGAGDQAGTWAAVAPAFTSGFRVVLLDLPGHGGSAPAAGPLPMGTVLSATREALATLCSAETVVVGNSLGAWLACLLTAEPGLPLRGVVLVNGGPVRGHYLGPALAPKDRAEARQVMRVLLGKAGERVPGFVLDDVVRAAQRGPIPRLLAALDSWEPHVWGEEQLRGCQVPVLLAWGEEDGLFDRAYAEKLASSLPKARLEWLAGCGHVPQRQCPEPLRKALAQWLPSVVGSGVAR